MSFSPDIRPNIVVITAHDIGRHLGCYGVPESATPNIDRFSAEGVRFSNFYSTAPQCSPARASLATGRFPHSNGVLGICSPVFGFDLGADEKPLVSHLKQNGYNTARIGIVHETMHPERFPYDFVGNARDADACASEVTSYIETATSPFYLQIGTRQAHRPFTDAPHTENGVCIPPWLEDEPEAREELAGFQGSIHVFDTAVGRILDVLGHKGIAQNTLVIILSDHGIPFPRAKHSLYEPGCAVAALLRWPARRWNGGRVIDSLISGVDLLPTILRAVGLDVPTTVQGRSFHTLLDGDGYKERDAVYTEQNYNAWTDISRAVRTNRYKLIANFTPGRGFSDSSQTWRPSTKVCFLENAIRTHHPPFELYDLETDPLETVNVAEASDYRATFAQMKKRLWNWMQQTQDPLLHGPPIPPIYNWTLDGLRQGQESVI